MCIHSRTLDWFQNSRGMCVCTEKKLEKSGSEYLFDEIYEVAGKNEHGDSGLICMNGSTKNISSLIGFFLFRSINALTPGEWFPFIIPNTVSNINKFGFALSPKLRKHSVTEFGAEHRIWAIFITRADRFYWVTLVSFLSLVCPRPRWLLVRLVRVLSSWSFDVPLSLSLERSRMKQLSYNDNRL